MNRWTAHLLIAVAIIIPDSVFADDPLESLLFQYEVALTELEKPLKSLETSYDTALQKIAKSYREQGDLDAVLEVAEEQKDFRTSSDDRELSERRTLRDAQQIFLRERSKILPEIEKKRIALIETFEDQLESLEKELTISNNVELAKKVREKREVIAREKGKSDTSGGNMILVETFDSPPKPEAWSVKGPYELQAGQMVNQRGTTELVTAEPISGNFVIEVDIKREGSHTWAWFDMAIAPEGLWIWGALRLGRGGENLIYLNSTDKIEKGPGNPDQPHIVSNSKTNPTSEGGTFRWIKEGDELRVEYIDSSGRTINAGPVEVPQNMESKMIIRFAGTQDTPRKLTEIRISRL